MSGRVAVIVGGTGQVGRSVVCAFRDDGFHVISISMSKANNLHEESGVEYLYGDMTRTDQIEEFCTYIMAKHEKVDLLVNLIGKNINCPFNEITEEIWNAVIDTNLKSVFFICRTFANAMLIGNGGAIINCSSTAGIKALPQSPHYIAAKAGVIALTQFFAKVFAPSINVNCIAPGFILTENHLPENYTYYDDMVSQIPLKRMTTVDEIVKAILFLAKSSTCTGHTFVLDGGLIL